MPYDQIPTDQLVVGKEYILTHICCKDRRNTQRVMVEHNNYLVNIYAQPHTFILPPTSVEGLRKGFHVWRAWYTENFPGTYFFRKKSRYEPIEEMEFRKKMFYAGDGTFCQPHSFGAKRVFDPTSAKEHVNLSNWAVYSYTPPLSEFHENFTDLVLSVNESITCSLRPQVAS